MVKIERSYPAPQSLAEEAKKKSGSYEKEDVINQLKQDFHNKCYICEMKNLQDPEVEHLLPHKNGTYPDRKFNRDNLFWSCGHCNKVKNRAEFEENIIDCCREDPEDIIVFDFSKDNIDVISKDTSNRKAVLTAKLITDVFNLQNTGMRVQKSQMRLEELQTEMNAFLKTLERFKNKPKSKVTARMLKALLKRESAFAGFKRGYIREHLNQYAELEKYIR